MKRVPDAVNMFSALPHYPRASVRPAGGKLLPSNMPVDPAGHDALAAAAPKRAQPLQSLVTGQHRFKYMQQTGGNLAIGSSTL